MPNRTNFQQLISENFGELTAQQLWALVRLSKNVRLRCRNNAAFNNFFNTTFPYAKFSQVMKTRISYKTQLPEQYPGLQITVKGQTVEDNDEE